MNVSLTRDLEAFVQAKVESGRYNNASEVVREALRLMEERDQERRLEALLLEGLESGRPVELDDDWWARKRTQLQRRLQRRRSRKRDHG